MTYSYFPGCTLKNKATDLDIWARKSAEALGFTLEEIPEWQCCGGEYPMAKDEIASKLSSVRALANARDSGKDLVTLCSACYNVLKQVNNDVATDETVAFKVNNYLKQDEIEYHGEAKVLHYLEILRDVVGWDKVKAAVKKPFTGKKIGAYYGCLLLRPGKVLQLDDHVRHSVTEVKSHTGAASCLVLLSYYAIYEVLLACWSSGWSNAEMGRVGTCNCTTCCRSESIEVELAL